MTTDFLGFEKPSKDDRINIDVLNDNTDEIDKHFERTSIVLSVTDNNISVDATGPYYTVTNNNADTVQALLEGNSMLLDPGETFKMNKDATDTFTLEVTCASDVTVTYFQRNKDYVDGSLASDLANYYDKPDSDSIFLKTEDFSDMRNEESSSVCSVDLPLKYNAIGNPVEEYRIHGDTSQPATPTLASAAIPIGTGDLVTDSESEHYNEYALPIINNSIAYNVYLATPLYRVNDKSDYIDYARQKVIRNVGIIVYDGSADEEWENYEYKNYSIDLTNLGGGDNPHVSYEVLCDKLLKTSEDNLGIATNRIAICDGKVRVHFNSALTTVSEFKAYLQSNPITVYYPLASEVTEDVTLPDIPTISGENQLYVDTTELPKNVVVGAAMQYFSPREMYESFPSKDDFWTKSESEKYTTAEKNKLASITNPIKLKGRVDSISDLPADAEIGWLYFVGTESTVDKEEYVYTEDGTWEHIGTAEVDLSNYYTKSEVNTAISNKADSTVLTAHTSNTDIHVTAADKTAWNIMPRSKTIDQILGINVCKDFVIPLIEVTTGVENTYFCGRIFLKRTNGANDEITIINAMCGKRYNEEKAAYNIDSSEVFTPIKPCIFTYNSKKYFGIHVNITSSEYEIFRVDARTTTNYNDIKMIFIYDTSTSQIINAEIYNSLDFAAPGKSVSTNFYAVPQLVDGTVKRKLLYFSPVPATLTSSGTIGDIAYNTNYLYMCTAANTWKRTAWGADVYSTTETVVGTHTGKPLYRAVVGCGALPNNATKEILHNIANIHVITNIFGTCWDNAGTFTPLPSASLTSPITIYSDKSKIYITTVTDKSTVIYSNIIIEYTKIADA